MFQFTKAVIATTILASTFLLGGCQSHENAGPHAMMDMSSTSKAMACDKCETTWVQTSNINTAGGGRVTSITGYSKTAKMVCPECKSAVANLFATGKMEHTCTACGGNMTGCAVVSK